MTKSLIALAPAKSIANDYVNLFARSIDKSRFVISHYDYRAALPSDTKLLLLHWPNIFFSSSACDQNQAEILLSSWLELRATQGMKVVWIAHNPCPHDRNPALLATNLLRRFMQALDGVIYLSSHGQQVIEQMYLFSPPRSLIIAHGDYTSTFSIPPSAAPRYSQYTEPCRLLFFGQIRPYKGLEDLIEASHGLDSLRISIKISGFCSSPEYRRRLEGSVGSNSCVDLDLHDNLLEGQLLEKRVDCCHGVILPYRKILHSGATLYSLSRHRPVLAPALGGLVELVESVGADWLNLYQPPIDASIINEFANSLAAKRTNFCDLSSQSWYLISSAINAFLIDLANDA